MSRYVAIFHKQLGDLVLLSPNAETVASSIWLHGGFTYEVRIPTAHCVNASRQLPLEADPKSV